MIKKDIDNIVWWIPFRKTRDSIRKFLLTVYSSKYVSNDFIYKFSYKKKDLSDRFDIKFYLPDYPSDFIQSSIVFDRNFFDIDTIESVNKYFKDDSIILDIGSNIGNHSLYWAIVRKAKKIIAFEPCKAIYDVFKENIEINSLDNIITLNNFALGAEETNASINMIFSDNLGGTHIEADDAGSMQIKVLDNLDLDVSHIDFIKIDVEGFELNVLKGAIKTIKKYKPILMIESAGVGLEKVKVLLNELNYSIDLSLNYDHIFTYNE